MAGALSELSTRTRAAMEAAAAFRPSPRTVQTRDMGIHPRHLPDGTQAGHTAYQMVRVSLPQPQRAGELVTRLSRAVGDSFGIDSVALGVSDVATLTLMARELAFEDARSTAKQYAALAGRQLGRVEVVSEVPQGGSPLPRRAALTSRDTAVPVEPGQHQVVVTVTVRWELR